MANVDSQRTDALGARASNAGDQFQELWALQQALGLLNPSTGLAAVTVEGIKSETVDNDQSVWDGVDCALYFGGKSLETATEVFIAQLKYSTTKPDDDWTIARLTYSKKKVGNNSVLRRLADAFTAATSRMQADSKLVVRLVSNQGVASEVFEVVNAILNEVPSPPDAKLAATIEKVKLATGLSDESLVSFLKVLDLSEDGTASRHSLRGSITKHVAEMVGEDEGATVRELMYSIRELMMPEKAREFISRETVLGWCGVAAETGLFPAPSDFKTVTDPIEREPARALLTAIQNGTRVICLHGSAGCGKTTTLMQLRSLLPPSSVLPLFDCYGGGKYLLTSDRRHLPEHAFTQIANELSLDLGIPFLLARSSKSPVLVKRFLERIRLAADLLSKADPNAILVIGIDAADNSVTAAGRQNPPEPCFVTELAQADLAILPPNARIVFSARTGRKESLRLSSTAAYVPCPAFNLDETNAFVGRFFPNISRDWVEQFHALSGGIPRVQDYAIAGKHNPLDALNALRPNGKNLTDVLRLKFKEAVTRSGNGASYHLLMSSIDTLPAPIPPAHLANVSGLSATEITDFVQDTWPGLRLEDGGISIADEDVEDFIRDEGRQELQQAQKRACDHLLPIHTSDSYAAVNIGDLLVAAGRETEILPMLETNLSPAGIPDPIVRREVQLRRLRLAHAACRSAGDSAATMKVVLLGAEASKDQAFLSEMLDSNPDLSTRFARTSLIRLVLSDADSAKRQGRILVHDALQAAQAANKIQARDQLHYFEEWLRRRSKVPKDENDGWKIHIDDIVTYTEAIALIDGLADAREDLRRWTYRPMPLVVALDLFPRLISQGRGDIVEAALHDRLLPRAWDILLLVPIALSGTQIDRSRLEKTLLALRRSLIPPLHGIRRLEYNDEWRPKLQALLVTACEIALSLGVSDTAIRKAIGLVVDFDNPFEKRYTSFEPEVLDILVRAWLVRRHLDGSSHSADDFLNFVDPPPAPKEEEGRRDSSKLHGERRTGRDMLEEEQRRLVKTVFPVYETCLVILADHRKSGQASAEHINGFPGFGSDEYYLKRSYDGSTMRANAATSVLNLMHLNGAPWNTLFNKAADLASPEYSDPFGHHLLPLWRLLLLRPDTKDFVLSAVVERMPIVRAAREPASDKVNAAIKFSRLVLSFSEPDARVFFESAVLLAQEIDREAINQIGVLEALTSHQASWDQSEKKAAVATLVNVLTDIAERLRNEEHFPWEECLNSLVRLHPPTALAALSRWSDQGLRPHDDNLKFFLAEMGRLNTISPAVAASLLSLMSNVPRRLRLDVVARLKANGQAPVRETIDLLADDILRYEEPKFVGRHADDFIREVSSLGLTPEGHDYQRLIETHCYLSLINEVEQPSKANDETVPELQGTAFTTKAAIEYEFNSARSKGYFNAGPFLARMADTVTSPGDRVPFLNALSASNLGEYSEAGRVEATVAALSKWNSPSVNRWRTQQLPHFINQHFLGLTRMYEWWRNPLAEIIAATQLPPSDKLAILAEGLENSSLSLGNKALFAISEQMATFLSPEQAWAIFEWHLKRLVGRVSLDESAIQTGDLPETIEEGLGRFLFALMGDIDTRIRWRAAHATRRLARLGESAILDALFAQYDRSKDDAFRDPRAPYYWLAARLWSVISTARIAHESPQSLKGVHTKLIAIALDKTLPHVVIRENAKATLLALHEGGQIVLDEVTAAKIREINISPFPPDERPESRTPRLQWGERKGKRFDFGLDTAEYVLSPILKMFIGLSKEVLFEHVEHWLIDQWKAPEKVHYWDLEPRKGRYDERRYGLYHSQKGSRPTIERHGFYLEWHAIQCAVGELMEKYPLWKSEDRWGTFQHWLSRMLLTVSPAWLADLRDPKPLEDQFWLPGVENENRWVRQMARQDFFAALFARNGSDKSQVNVAGSWTSAFPKRETRATISSALVNSATASALARSLAMRERKQWPHYFPTGETDDERDEGFNEPPYRLAGWLVNVRPDEEAFDGEDTLRNGTRGKDKSFAVAILSELKMEAAALPAKTWKIADRASVAAREIIWADLPERYDEGSSYRRRETKSDGTLLQIDADVLLSLLQMRQMSLIISVHFERRLEEEYGRYSDQTKKAKHFEQFFIFRADGTIESDKGTVGTWGRSR
ncbi:hypothetical protein [Bradyrhizobium sp. SZCCHNS3051]|uniref:hypothetical protein n=1 Tax=Bradyrhizobium sp. SZCCHNS3051 TaxID=3057320 RepID=UPI002916475D|nr:hypothetical protein [Bradyrhizobium sp. SZCCHNS3051]